MKQKQIKTTPKVVKQTKVTKKAVTPKKVQEVVEESDDSEEEAEMKVFVPKKAANKKKTKVPKVIEMEEPVEDEEEEEDDEYGQDVEENDEDEAIDCEDDENEELEDDDNDDEEEDEEDNEEPAEDDEPVEDEEPTIPSKVKSGEIPPTVPSNRVVHITKLPKKCKQIDVVEVFAKYGAIEQIHIVTTPGGTVANVAFKTEKAAKAALSANKKVKVQDNFILVTLKKDKNDAEQKPKKQINDSRERSVYVRYVKAGTTEEQLIEHFEDCGEIESIKLVNKHNATFGFVTFTDKAFCENALKLHNSVLNGANIGVCENTNNPTKVGQIYDEKLTVMVKNNQAFKTIDSSKLEEIFAKCGEVAAMDVVCRKNVLAFITFKTEQSAQKALKLNGKTEQGFELDLELYNPYSKKTTIYVSNLPKDCTEEDIRNSFSRAGEIVQILHKFSYAIIRFEDSDAYCKSFLFNESFINNQMIFVEPHSIRKKAIMKSKQFKNFHKRGYKRPAENGNGVFRFKKTKTY